jgi:23S rRNA (guanosine2251-2'-O)-methyltransferase
MTKFDKIAAIIGSEQKGMRPLVRKNCDLIVKIPINKNIDSLNASNAAAIFFSEIARVNNLTI